MKGRKIRTGKGKAKGPKVWTGQGKEFSKVSRETETYFRNWLQVSGITENEVISAIDREDFDITFRTDKEMALTVLHTANGEIGMPFIWQKESGIKFESYKLDAALLLLFIAEKNISLKSKVKIKSFVRRNLA